MLQNQVLTIFSKNPVYAFIFKHFKVAGDLFHRYNGDRIDVEGIMTPHEAFREFVFPDPNTKTKAYKAFKEVTKLIKKAIWALPSYTRSCIKAVDQYPFNVTQHALQIKCLKQNKGSSFVYKALIDNRADKQDLNTPLSYVTSKRDQRHTITEEEWKQSLKRLGKIHCSSKTRWQNIQIFLRTLWTPMKHFLKTDEITDGLCPGCGDHWPANTAHIIYECSGLASNVWNFVRNLMQQINDKPFKLHKMAVIYFHQITSYLEVGIIAAAKRAIIRVLYSVHHPIHPKVSMHFLQIPT